MQGIVVFYDFVWRTEFNHGRAVFPGCKGVAKRISESVNKGQRTVVLLTTQNAAPPFQVQKAKSGEHVFIWHVANLKATASIDRAGAAVAAAALDHSDALAAVETLKSAPEAIQELLGELLDEKKLLDWVSVDSGRLKIMAAILRSVASENSQTFAPVFVEVLAHLAKGADELAKVFKDADEGALRVAAAVVLYAQQAADIERLRELVAEELPEARYQDFFDSGGWWMFGSQYVELVDDRRLCKGDEQDFILKTADGFYDIVEIKTPAPAVLDYDNSRHHFFPSAATAQALGQVLSYLSHLDAELHTIAYRDNLDVFRARATVVIGRSLENGEWAKALRNLNSTLSRVEILTFDQVLASAESILRRTRNLLDQTSGAIPRT